MRVIVKKIFDIIFSKYLDESLFYKKDINGHNLITYLILNNNNYFIEKIFNTDLIREDLFTMEIQNGWKLLDIVVYSSTNIIDIVINSKYCKSEYLCFYNQNDSNPIIGASLHSLENFKKL